MTTTTFASEGAVDELDRRIIAALQVNGRAGWRQIAAVLGVPERTVAAHGTELIRSGKIKVCGFTVLPDGGVREQSIVYLRSQAGMNRVAAAAAANRADSVFSMLTNGEVDCIFELLNDRERTASIVLDELPAIPGVASVDATTVIRLYKPSFHWVPKLLSADEIAGLEGPNRSVEPSGAERLAPLDRDEREITRVLATDGRATIEELARASLLSPSSVRRRLAHLQASRRLYIYTLVEPAVIGYPVGAILRIRTRPSRIDRVAQLLMQLPEIRYLAFTTGRYQLFAEVACASQNDLNEFLFRDDWTEQAVEIDTAMLIQALKRGSVRSH